MSHPGKEMNRGAALLLIIVLTAGLSGCIGHLASEPGVFEARRVAVALHDRELHLTCVKPQGGQPPPFLILFATGDAGWLGISKTVFERIAQRGFYAAGFSSREGLKVLRRSEGWIDPVQGTVDLELILQQAKRALGLPEETPAVLAGVSRGAGMVVFGAANRKLQPALAGAIAVALTREADYLRVPDPLLRLPGIETDEKGRLLLYPAITRLGSLPIAVIQSTGDKYVPAAQARSLFGPDTSTRRLYEVEASNHGFSGGRDDLLRDLDDALAWIASLPRPAP